ncbi:hypothetical protein JHV56_09810 [Arthrobacter sp. BHU FT2]|nr:hypothetical protein [Arthrobacter sp. BHU FT2]
MTAVAEPQGQDQQPLADVVALPLPHGYGDAGDIDNGGEQASGADGWMKAITVASAKLEQLQWEVDAAEEDLCAALRGASASSVSASVLARAAGLTTAELETYLARPALAAAPVLAAAPSLASPAQA